MEIDSLNLPMCLYLFKSSWTQDKQTPVGTSDMVHCIENAQDLSSFTGQFLNNLLDVKVYIVMRFFLNANTRNKKKFEYSS